MSWNKKASNYDNIELSYFNLWQFIGFPRYRWYNNKVAYLSGVNLDEERRCYSCWKSLFTSRQPSSVVVSLRYLRIGCVIAKTNRRQIATPTKIPSLFAVVRGLVHPCWIPCYIYYNTIMDRNAKWFNFIFWV